MPRTTLIEQQGLKESSEKLQQALVQAHLAAMEARSPGLAKKIKEDTVSPGDIDNFLDKAGSLPAGLEEFILCKKAWLLFQQGREEQGLQVYDEALSLNPESPSTWASKGSGLLILERPEEAFQAFEKAYLYREDFGPQKQGYLSILFNIWSAVSLILAFLGIQEQDLREAEKGIQQYLTVSDHARAENLDSAVLNLAVEKPVSKDIQDALEELELMVRLLSIKDPFDRWRELTKEISKVWPEGVSAVDAIREQRDHEWNT